MIKLHIWKLRAPVQPSGRQPLGPGRSEPYYGNYVQPKCNCSDARATQSGHGLVMEAFGAILERRLQLTISTLGQAVRTPSGILVITLYWNIGLGRNRPRWKAKKSSINWAPGRPLYSSRRTPSGWPWLPSGRACHRIHFLLDFGFPKPINKRLEACFEHRIQWRILYSLEMVFREILKIW